ncbi:hypothetical protein M527_05975 [Sphingobium indicum IP26]|uniref:Uncharacterized protein n=1 Tax=Sphingobium indicum F2 TaxID=1450518 RepID=A0A8E0WSS2_9SPHN|nr:MULTISPECIES: hypothetical protein [Sphingobium]EPR09673.1 hypothetical protein M527_05975 [Sphingobium indicum IP26]EQB04862.1 hypothetical protein L286_08815 [Sphingobium sp. HDIP04]KER36253.1 hypothetical protein AL00_12095 [Sphingobium indicum F2]KER38297.1 hypothetical protein AL00_00830 [Sphingobium indicum F2]
MIVLLILFSVVDLLLLLGALWMGQGSGYWFAPVHLALSCAALLVAMKRLAAPERFPSDPSRPLIKKSRKARNPERQSDSIRSKPALGVLQRFALPVGAAIGPAGMLGCLMLAPLARRSGRKRQIAYRNVRTGKRRKVGEMSPVERLGRILDDRVRYPESDEIGSLATMLRYGNLQARYRALETAVISFEPRLSPLIVMALSDEDQTIRALAAAAAAQVSYNLAQQRGELQARIAPSQHLDDRYALAMLLADHGCFNQLLPQGQRLRLCQEANRKLAEIAGLLKGGDIRRRALQAARAQLRRAMERHQPGQARSAPLAGAEPAT